MTFNEILVSRKASILESWRKTILDSYPHDASRFLGEEKDRFHNPVGDTLRRDTEIILDHLVYSKRYNGSYQFPQGYIKIRAVQNFTAAEAVGFIFSLKEIIRAEMIKATAGSLADLQEIDKRIDETALVAFDAYMKARDAIHEIKVNEIRRRFGRMAAREEGLVTDKSTSESLPSAGG